jgi:hypothetical protein
MNLAPIAAATTAALSPRFDLRTALHALSAVLSDDEIGALAPLVEEKKRVPEGLLRYEGALYVRYMASFWRINEGVLAPFHGMFPNAALCSGVEQVVVGEL